MFVFLICLFLGSAWIWYGLSCFVDWCQRPDKSLQPISTTQRAMEAQVGAKAATERARQERLAQEHHLAQERHAEGKNWL